jgi:hypothetical protein
MRRMQPMRWGVCALGAALGLSVVLGLGHTSTSGARSHYESPTPAHLRSTLGPPPLRYQIYSMNADGTDPTNLSNDPDADDSTPAWSPLGGTILFSRWTGNGGADIFAMNEDGSGQRDVDNDPGGHDR